MTLETKSKKKINSKAKGNAGERNIVKLLNDNFAPLKFTRSQMSGAILGGKNVVNLDNYSKEAKVLFTGDVVPTNEESTECDHRFRFCIESKNYKDTETLESLFNPTSRIFIWLNEVEIDSKKIEKEGIVLFKFNRTPYYAAVNKNIELPSIKYITLWEGTKVCHLDDLLQHKDFWLVRK